MPTQFLAHNGGGYGVGYGGGKPYQSIGGQQQQQQGGMAYQQGGQGQGHGGYHGGGQYHGGGGGGGGGGGQNPNAELEAEVKKYLPKVLRVIKRQCCVVM